MIGGRPDLTKKCRGANGWFLPWSGGFGSAAVSFAGDGHFVFRARPPAESWRSAVSKPGNGPN